MAGAAAAQIRLEQFGKVVGAGGFTGNVGVSDYHRALCSSGVDRSPTPPPPPCSVPSCRLNRASTWGRRALPTWRRRDRSTPRLRPRSERLATGSGPSAAMPRRARPVRQRETVVIVKRKFSPSAVEADFPALQAVYQPLRGEVCGGGSLPSTTTGFEPARDSSPHSASNGAQ